jgi:hypothetical protein
MVVIAVAVMLTGLLMPAMSALRENADKLICASNQRTIGQAIFLYTKDNSENLPLSYALTGEFDPKELMASRRADVIGTWDGLGLLYEFHYCSAPECFYCPSHHGSHPFERYADEWRQPSYTLDTNLYTNYHYGGHVDWDTKKRRRLDRGHDLVLATDGLRTANDFNHVSGMNELRGDGSVTWREDTKFIESFLPSEGQAPGSIQEWTELWNQIEDAAN